MCVCVCVQQTVNNEDGVCVCVCVCAADGKSTRAMLSTCLKPFARVSACQHPVCLHVRPTRSKDARKPKYTLTVEAARRPTQQGPRCSGRQCGTRVRRGLRCVPLLGSARPPRRCQTDAPRLGWTDGAAACLHHTVRACMLVSGSACLGWCVPQHVKRIEAARSTTEVHSAGTSRGRVLEHRRRA